GGPWPGTWAPWVITMQLIVQPSGPRARRLPRTGGSGPADAGVEGAPLRRAFNDFRWLSSIVSSMDQNRRPNADPPRGARPRPTRVSPATYWRRRMIVLAVGIGLLTTISWAASGLLAARSTASQAAHTRGTSAEPSAPP